MGGIKTCGGRTLGALSIAPFSLPVREESSPKRHEEHKGKKRMCLLCVLSAFVVEILEAIRLSFCAFDRLLKVDKLIIVGLKPVAFFGAADADASGGGFGAADSVLAEHQVIMVAANDNAGATFLGAVVEDAVGLEDIAVSAHRLALFAEKHAGLGVGGD